MSSSVQGKSDSQVRRVSEEEAAVFPDRARSSDESPTVISKTPPSVEQVSSSQNKITDLARKSPAPEAMAESLRGRKLAHFELIEPIGVGGMAAVIRARDTQLDRFVALKILPPEMAQEPENIQRFHQEAKAAAKLDHENIARVFFCGEDQGLHFIAFEFVEGENLRNMLEKRGRIPVGEAIRYILQVAAGLEHAATRGVVHRDVKPSNIIITPSGRAKLVDMGLARNMERRNDKDLTHSGVTLGTFDYISPEQALEPRDADARSDIYSLGCTLYHLLTGQSPVPDGTPAKKLHHHQHVAPVDPRVIDPIIPDDLVLILGKMMAKNPKDRFQRPIHLVHHLMKIAQKVGAANDLPEGVLVVDAPIVAEPRGRPLLLIGLSLVILVAVVMLVGILSDPAPYGVPQPISRITDSKDVGVKRDDKKDSAKTTVPHTSPVRAVHNREDWHKFLSDASRSVNAKMEAEPIALDGTSIQAAKDQFLTLESDRADENTLQFLYTNAVPVGLVIESGEEITFRRIRFQIDSDGAPLQSAAAVAIRGGKTIRFEQCIFAQAKVPRVAAQRTPLASILIDAPTLPDGARPTVYLDRCYFDSNNPPGGQIAVAINGPAKVIATNCAFRPHAAYFSFRDKCTLDSTEVTAENCVGFVETGPVFRLSKNASAQIRARHNVFSRPGLGLGSAEQPGLIYRAGSLPFRYEGKANIYHHLNALVEKRLSLEKSSDIIGTPEAFQSELAQWQGTDANSTHIPLNDPSSPFLASAAGADQDLAFQLKPEHQRAGLGLQKTWLNSEWPDAVAAKNPPPMPRKKIVDADDDTPGIYKNVLEALAAAKHGDVIWIKHGEDPYVEVPPIELKPGVSVTLKPYDETFHPILVLDKAFRNKDSALFKVRNGALNIEHMEIRLDPVQEDFVTQSMIHMGESAQLSFTNCVLTLRGPEKVQLNVATFIDLDLMPKMEAASSGSARVEFRDCFVRGKGDLVALRGCRRLHVEVKNSLIALQGSLLDIEAASRAMAMGDGVTWRMERSSIIAGDSLFAFRINAGKVLTETKADVEDCLLATFSNGTPAAQHIIDGIRSEELGKVFSWRGRHNYFANFEMQDVREWKDRDADGKSEIGTLSFPKFEDKTYLQRLWDATPDWFRPAAVEQERISGFGVPPDIEKRLLPPDTEE